jgi:hypothetical protein
MFTAAEEIPWPGCDSFFGASFAVVFDAMGGILALSVSRTRNPEIRLLRASDIDGEDLRYAWREAA